jgi:hypothetical protein
LRSVLLDAAKVNESTDISDMTALRRSSKSRTPATTLCSTSHFALIATRHRCWSSGRSPDPPASLV